MIELPLTAPHAAEIESHNGEVAMHERVVELVDDLVVHCAAELRVRMQHNGDRCVLLRSRMVAAFDSAGRTGEDDFRHSFLDRVICRNALEALPPNR